MHLLFAEVTTLCLVVDHLWYAVPCRFLFWNVGNNSCFVLLYGVRYMYCFQYWVKCASVRVVHLQVTVS
jgi:hypothetical protein